MENVLLFTSVATSLLIYSLVALWYIVPWSRRVSFAQAMTPLMPRFAGLILLMSGITAAEVVRHDAVMLFGTTLVVRAVALAGILSLALRFADPFFWWLLGVVGAGEVLTLLAGRADRARHRLTPAKELK